MLHNRSLKKVCVFLLATWVGGAYVIGTAAAVYNPTEGLIWALMPMYLMLNFVFGKYSLLPVYAYAMKLGILYNPKVIKASNSEVKTKCLTIIIYVNM